MQTPLSAGPLAESCCSLMFLSALCLSSRWSSVSEQVLTASNLKRRQQQQRPQLPCRSSSSDRNSPAGLQDLEGLLSQLRICRQCNQQGHLPDTASSNHNRNPLAGVCDRNQSCKLQAKKGLQRVNTLKLSLLVSERTALRANCPS